MAPTLSAYLPWIEFAAVALLLAPLLLLGRIPIGYNLRNITVRWRITALTALAFTFVVGMLVIMLAFVNGMNRLTEGSAQPGNVIVLSDGATDELFSTLTADDTADMVREPGIMRDAQGQPLASRELYVVVNQPMPLAPGETQQRRRFVQIRGLEDPATACRVHGMDLYPGGRYFSPAGVQDIDKDNPATVEAIQALVGEGLARELGREQGKLRLDIGDLFTLGPRRWVVVGILKSSGSTFDSEVWAKAQKVGDQFGKQNVFTSVVLRTPSAEIAKDLSDRLKNFQRVRLAAQPETAYYAKLTETNEQLRYAIYFVAMIMAVGGVFGIMNTMFAAISQRTRDIGVLRILGYTRRQILMSFLLEALLIALIGGAVGCAIGSLANGWSATSVVSSGEGGGKTVLLKLTVDSSILAVGVIFAVVMGLLGGLLPSLSAMRLKPLEAVK
ncbi:MAG TPA: FtsX-like permease family protein [Gemmataceae bacterium]|nr:FtsX-like permease family protein [Gemmataceae bacterium]